MRPVMSLGDVPMVVLASGMFLQSVPEPRLAFRTCAMSVEQHLQRDLGPAVVMQRVRLLSKMAGNHAYRSTRTAKSLPMPCESWLSR